MKTTFFPAFSRRANVVDYEHPIHFTMGDRKTIKRTEWASWITVILLPAGWIWIASQKSADVDHLKEGQVEQKTATMEVRREVSDMKGDIKAMKALLERLELEQKRP